MARKKKYQCILSDPPWLERGGGVRGAQTKYPLLPTPEIIRVMYQCPLWNPHENCLHWMWVTNNFLEDGLFVMKALGFKYITNFIWAKDRVGTGQRSRSQHEIMLLGRRGRVPIPKPKDRQSTVLAGKLLPRTPRHSEKPPEGYRTIEKSCKGPRLELFARSGRRGWDSWGNELAA